jgi:hypothetical protein
VEAHCHEYGNERNGDHPTTVNGLNVIPIANLTTVKIPKTFTFYRDPERSDRHRQ